MGWDGGEGEKERTGVSCYIPSPCTAARLVVRPSHLGSSGQLGVLLLQL